MKTKTLLQLAKDFCAICPNCGRELPHPKFRRKWGCPWCVPEKETPYGNGKYD